MNTKSLLLVLLIIIVYVLHQDFWNWHTNSIVLGFIPIGLAYHAGFSILASVMMAILVRSAWPEHLERSADEDSPDSSPREPSH